MTNYAQDHVPDWSRTPDPVKMTLLVEWVRKSDRLITAKNFRRWLVELAYEHDDSAACSNGKDHACNRGLGEWLGIEAYGQGTDGSVPWQQQTGFSSERLNRYVDPAWQNRLLTAPAAVQREMYARLLTTLRDEHRYDYSVRELIPAELDEAING